MSSNEAIAEIEVTLHEDAIGKVSRFFNGTDSDILTEILQNARRSGATRVEVTADEDQGLVTIRDDGAGIADFRAVLGFGRSDWDDAAAREEDPAGMGLFSLARRRWSITSRRRDGDPWTVTIGPEQFEKGTPATVYRAEPDAAVGTTVSFQVDQLPSRALERAAEFFPLPVVLNGEELVRRGFLDRAVRRERWNGLEFGAYRDNFRVNQPEMNFHGVTIQAVDLPSLWTIGERWTLNADVEHAPELALVLPARKEIVESAFAEEMRAEGRRMLMRTIATAQPAARVPAALWREAAKLGIELPLPAAELQRFKPDYGALYRIVPAKKFIPVPADALVFDADVGAGEQHSFMRAAARAGLDTLVFHAVGQFERFEWYDRLPRIKAVEIVAIMDGEEYRFGNDEDGNDYDGNDYGGRQGIAEQITIRYTVERTGTREIRELPADVGLTGITDACFHNLEGWLLVTRDTDLDPAELAKLLENVFFDASNDGDANSYDTQLGEFERDALEWAVKMLGSKDEALRTRVALEARSVAWHLRGRGGVVRVDRDGGIRVRLAPEAREVGA